MALYKAKIFNGCSNNLFSRAVSSKVFSALVSLTSVFGMRTGGTSLPSSPQWYITDSLWLYLVFVTQYHIYIENISHLSSFVKANLFGLAKFLFSLSFHINSLSLFVKRSSPRPISIGQLNTLLHLHLRPINLVVFKGSYYLTIWDILS